MFPPWSGTGCAVTDTFTDALISLSYFDVTVITASPAPTAVITAFPPFFATLATEPSDVEYSTSGSVASGKLTRMI